MRWLGHQLQAKLHIVVDEKLPTRESHVGVEAGYEALPHENAQLEDAQKVL